MTYYKSLDPARQAKAQTFHDGRRDGYWDAIRESRCPPQPAYGMQQEGWMYKAGYDQTYKPTPCRGCLRCQRAQQKR